MSHRSTFLSSATSTFNSYRPSVSAYPLSTPPTTSPALLPSSSLATRLNASLMTLSA